MRGLNEIVPIQDVLASGLGAIERMDGGLYRLWFYVMQTEDEGEPPEKILVAKVVIHASIVPDVVMHLVGAVSGDQTKKTVPQIAELIN